MLKKYFLFCLSIVMFVNLFGQKVQTNEAVKLVDNFILINSKTSLLKQNKQIHTIYSKTKQELLFYVINFNKAYFVVSADKSNTPIKAFSFKHKLNTDNNGKGSMLDILKADYANFQSLKPEQRLSLSIKNKKKWQYYLSDNLKNIKTDETYGPWLSSIYGQKWYYENGSPVYTTQYYTPNHNPVGCVALTFTELLQYYKWPRKGIGSNSYSDNSGNTTGTFQADFDASYYNWSIILDEYNGVSTDENERKELGKLAYHAAVSVNMDFESTGSTSNINRIPAAVQNYFRYTAEYIEKTETEFWIVLDSNLVNGRPAQLAVYTQSGAGHAIVCDGIKYISDEKYYHLNMGWWGDTNGWYQIHQTFNAGGYTNVTAAVVNMYPVPELSESIKFDAENKTAKLKWYYSEKIPAQAYEMQIKVGVADWQNYTDTITSNSYIFPYEGDDKIYVRLRAKADNMWIDNAWSNTVSFDKNDFKIKGSSDLLIKSSITRESIIVSYSNLEGSVIRIFDSMGNIVYESNENISTEEHKIDVSYLRSGIYILQVWKETEQITSKFLKL